MKHFGPPVQNPKQTQNRFPMSRLGISLLLVLASANSAHAAILDCAKDVYVVELKIRSNIKAGNLTTPAIAYVNKSINADASSPGTKLLRPYLPSDEPSTLASTSPDTLSIGMLSKLEIAYLNKDRVTLSDTKGRCLYPSGTGYYWIYFDRILVR
jgi:hypothetical protein